MRNVNTTFHWKKQSEPTVSFHWRFIYAYNRCQSQIHTYFDDPFYLDDQFVPSSVDLFYS